MASRHYRQRYQRWRLDDFEVGEQIGLGGFATVYRATMRSTGEDYALKKIDMEAMRQRGMMKRVFNEIKIHKGLDHPSVLKLYGKLEEQGFIYLILEYCPNGDLNHYLKKLKQEKGKSKLSNRQARSFMRQIIEGILYLHDEERVIHRDLKLANLLLDKDMNVKIADFGLATKCDPAEKHYTMCGTPNYIAPEIAMRGAHGQECDVWSLGCLLYTFLVGRPPFDTKEVMKTLDRVKSCQYSIPPGVDPHASDLIARMLDLRPRDRIALHHVVDHPYMTSSSYVTAASTSAGAQGSLADSGHITLSTENSSAAAADSPKARHQHHYHRRNSRAYDDDDSDYGDATYTVHASHLPGNRNHRRHPRPRYKPASYEDDDEDDDDKENLGRFNAAARGRSATRRQISYGEDEGFGVEVLRESRQKPLIRNRSEPNLKRHVTSPRDHRESGARPREVLPSPFTSRHRQPHSARDNRDEDSDKRASKMKLRRSSSLSSRLATASSALMSSTAATRKRTIDTTGLQPIRQRTKHAVVSILNDGWARLEVIKPSRDGAGEERISDVLMVSGDGRRVRAWKSDRPTSEEHEPIPDDAASYDGCEGLPRSLRNKYTYLEQFVALAATKTPKITFFSPKAKCALMEGRGCFEAEFYATGGTVTRTREGKTQVRPSKHQSLITLDTDALGGEEHGLESRQLVEMISHARHEMQQLAAMERKLELISSTMSRRIFPLRLNRRPPQPPQQQQQLKGNDKTAASDGTDSPTRMMRFGESLLSYRSHAAASSSSRDLVGEAGGPEAVRRRWEVPGVGVVHLVDGGRVWVVYEDGTQMLVEGVTMFPVLFQFADNERVRYDKLLKVPPLVKDKIMGLQKQTEKNAYR